jgi:hypothetical protein
MCVPAQIWWAMMLITKKNLLENNHLAILRDVFIFYAIK